MSPFLAEPPEVARLRAAAPAELPRFAPPPSLPGAPGPPPASPPAARLRAALARQARLPAIGVELGAALQDFVEHARADGLPPERMLMALKAQCREVVGLAPMAPGTPQTRLMELVVTRCIESYYRPGARPPTREGP